MLFSKLLVIIPLIGAVIFPAVTRIVAEEEETAPPAQSEVSALSQPEEKTGENTLGPDQEALEGEVPLSKREDIILLSKFFRGMGKEDVPKGWKLDNKITPIDISLVKEGDQIAVRLKSDESAFGIYNTQDFDIRDYPFLNWEWKVLELPVGGSFLVKDKDDQAAQVYISFGSLSMLNKPFVKALGYYWSSTLPVGTEAPCPTWGKSRAIVLETGEKKMGEWVAEKRNVYDDYARLFDDKDPSDVSAVRLYTNSQHTESSSDALFRNIYFSKE